MFGVMDSLPDKCDNHYAIDFWPGSDFFLNSRAARDLYGLDWGCQMGRVTRKRFPNFISVPNGWNVNEKDMEGGLEVIVVLERDVFERLNADETFMRYAELRCS